MDLTAGKMSKSYILQQQPEEPFHAMFRLPLDETDRNITKPRTETPYFKAKYVQLVKKDASRAIVLFWAAINAGDRVDSALKDMALLMKQQNRAEEAIEAIKSLRHLCSSQAQESLDNVMLDLYKRCGRLEDQIELLEHKLQCIEQGKAFKGKRTRTARSQGKKFQVSKNQETTRLLGNLAWTYMQQSKFAAAEAAYRKALSIEPDNNKMCNLGICLIKQGRFVEAKNMLLGVSSPSPELGGDSHLRSFQRAQEILQQIEGSIASKKAKAECGLNLKNYRATKAAALQKLRPENSHRSNSKLIQEEDCFEADKNSGRLVRYKLENEEYVVYYSDNDLDRLPSPGNKKYGFPKSSPKEDTFGRLDSTRLGSPKEGIIGKNDSDQLVGERRKNLYEDEGAQHANLWTNLSYCEDALEFIRAAKTECQDAKHECRVEKFPGAREFEGSKCGRRLRVFEEMTLPITTQRPGPRRLGPGIQSQPHGYTCYRVRLLEGGGGWFDP